MRKTKQTPPEVKAWTRAISERNPSVMVGFYANDALLLATFESLLVCKDAIYDYFV